MIDIADETHVRLTALLTALVCVTEAKAAGERRAYFDALEEYGSGPLSVGYLIHLAETLENAEVSPFEEID